MTTKKPQFLALFLLLIFLQQITDVTSKSYYHSDLVLDFLCASRTASTFVREVPWDCTAFVVCVKGRAVHSQCPVNTLFSQSGTRQKCLPSDAVDASSCQGKLFHYVKEICQANPTASVPSPDNCSHYLDCQMVIEGHATIDQNAEPHHFVEHLLECPYPLLFSPATGQCQHYSFVRCRHRFQPKTPCDYLQYIQLYNCTHPNCRACSQHHPSCLSLEDGYHPVPLRSDLRMKCHQERTVDIMTCPPGYRFSGPSLQCAQAS